MVCNDASKFTENDIPDLTGYVIIVTGGNSGIGLETSYHLTLHGARVYIASRSAARVETAIASLRARAGPDRTLDLRFLQVDLQDLRDVERAGSEFAEREERLDVLINNAGIMAVPFTLTMDGYESHFQVNYLAPFVLTSTFLALLLKTAASCRRKDCVRVVDLSSEMTSVVGPKAMVFSDVNLEGTKGVTVLLQRYAHSKQASIRQAAELNARYSAQGLTAYYLHPGVVRSNLQGHDPSLFGSPLTLPCKVH